MLSDMQFPNGIENIILQKKKLLSTCPKAALEELLNIVNEELNRNENIETVSNKIYRFKMSLKLEIANFEHIEHIEKIFESAEFSEKQLNYCLLQVKEITENNQEAKKLKKELLEKLENYKVSTCRENVIIELKKLETKHDCAKFQAEFGSILMHPDFAKIQRTFYFKEEQIDLIERTQAFINEEQRNLVECQQFINEIEAFKSKWTKAKPNEKLENSLSIHKDIKLNLTNNKFENDEIEFKIKNLKTKQDLKHLQIDLKGTQIAQETINKFELKKSLLEKLEGFETFVKENKYNTKSCNKLIKELEAMKRTRLVCKDNIQRIDIVVADLQGFMKMHIDEAQRTLPTLKSVRDCKDFEDHLRELSQQADVYPEIKKMQADQEYAKYRLHNLEKLRGLERKIEDGLNASKMQRDMFEVYLNSLRKNIRFYEEFHSMIEELSSQLKVSAN